MNDSTSNMPNLDAMTSTELWDFHTKHQRGANYRELFPDGGRHSKNNAGDLACYASNKATAMACRERGHIEDALMYERICDSIYKRLPAQARW